MTRSEFIEKWRGDFELTVSIERDLEELLKAERLEGWEAGKRVAEQIWKEWLQEAKARVGILTGALEYAVRFFGSGSFAMAGVGEAVEVMRAALGHVDETGERRHVPGDMSTKGENVDTGEAR